MAGLSNAEEIGGIVVTIAGNTAPFKAAIAEVKSTAAQAESQIVVKPRFDFGRLTADMSKLVSDRTSGLRLVAKLDMAQLRSDAVAILSSLSKELRLRIPVEFIDQPASQTRMPGNLIGTTVESGDGAAARPSLKSPKMEDAEEAGATAGDRFARGMTRTMRGGFRALGVMGGSIIASAGLEALGQVQTAFKMMGSGNQMLATEGGVRLVSAGENVPLLGGIVKGADAVSGASEAMQRNIDDMNRAESAGKIVRDRAQDIGAMSSQFGASEVERQRSLRNTRQTLIAAASASAKAAPQNGWLDNIDTSNIFGFRSLTGKTWTGYSAPIPKISSPPLLKSSANLVNEEKNAETVDEQRERLQYTQGIDAGHLSLLGDTRSMRTRDQSGDVAASRLLLVNSLDAESRRTQNQLDVLQKDPKIGEADQRVKDLKQRIADQQDYAKARLASFDTETNRDISRTVSGSVANIKASQQRLQYDSAGAEQTEINARYTPMIEAAGLKSGPNGNDVKQLREERDQVVKEAKVKRELESQHEIADAQDRGQVARLASSRDFYAADLAAFDSATRQKLLRMKEAGDSREAIDAESKSRSSERQALTAQQGLGEQNTIIGLRTRQSVAGARGEGEERLAGILSMIGGMRQELESATRQTFKLTGETQIAELQGLQKSLLRPNLYATEVNRGFDAAGGPDGDGGKESATILATIKDYIAELLNSVKNGVPAKVS